MNFTTNTTGSRDTTVGYIDRNGVGSNIVQVEFDAGITGTVRLFGRVASDCGWVQIGNDITADALVPILPVPLLRAEVTVASGGGGLPNIRVRSSLQ